MTLLALDTSTSAITVALHDGEQVRAERAVIDARRHTELLTPLIAQVLDEAALRPADLTAVAVGTGPGPFTGLRVGLVTARVLAHSLAVPLLGVCSLDALAHAAVRGGARGPLLVATDARRREVYWARYDAGPEGATRVGEPAVDQPAALPGEVRALPTVGRGPVVHPEHLPHGQEPLDVSAAALAEVALTRQRAGEAMPSEPLYLRRPDALTRAEQTGPAR